MNTAHNSIRRASAPPIISLVDYLDLLGRAVAHLDPTTVRSYRREARAFAGWCSAIGLDPLRPARGNLDRYFGHIGASANRAAKVRTVLRVIVRAARVPTDEHGIGTGNETRQLAASDLGTRLVFERVLDEAPVNRRAVVRSGLAKLHTWSVECEVDLLALAPADLDDYRRWLARVGNRNHGELMVIARKVLTAVLDPRVRKEVSRLRTAPSARPHNGVAGTDRLG